MIRIFIVLIGILTFGNAAEARIVESFRLGGWNGDAFVDDSTGLFNSCVAIAKYRSGISMSVEVDSNYNWWIGFSAPNWSMTTGEKIALNYRIDRGEWQSGVAEAISPQLARMEMPADGYIVRRFRRGRTLYVSDRTNDYQFRLTGTSKLLARLARCVKQNVARHGAGPGLARSGAQPPAASPEPKPGAVAVEDPQLQIEATQNLFNLMGQTGMTGLKLIADADRADEFKGLHAVAGNDQRTIVAHIFSEEQYENQTEVMAQLIFDAAKNCEGDFQSGFSADSIDGDELFAGRSSCAAGDVEISERYAIRARSSGGIVLFGVSETSVGEGGGEASAPKAELSDDMFHRAAVAVVQ